MMHTWKIVYYLPFHEQIGAQTTGVQLVEGTDRPEAIRAFRALGIPHTTIRDVTRID